MYKFNVEYLPEVVKFFRSIPQNAVKKLIYNIDKAKQTNDPTLFKKLKGTDIWEFRAKVNGIQYRLFSFWDKNRQAMVICTHGIIKKTQKTPDKEIAKAEQIRKDFLSL